MTCWSFVPATKEQAKNAELVVTQAWSRRRDGMPGNGNEVLADVALEFNVLYGLRVHAQEEVADCLKKHNVLAGVAGGSSTGASTLSWNTESVAKLQAEYCRANNIRRVLVVAHPFHMWRAVGVYKKLGLDALPAAVPWEIGAYQDPALVHWRFQKPWMIPIVWGWEMGLRVLFVLQDRL